MTRTTPLLAAEKMIAERSLMGFVRLMWPVVEPANPLVPGWAMEAVAEHLEAVARGQIKRLVINVPPGFSKSLLTNVFLPAWEWGPLNRPHLRYVTASYSASLTERDNERCMRLVTSPLYQALWGSVVKLEKLGVTKIGTNHTGWKLATSVGGVGTGERGDRVLIDDANNVQTAESEVIRFATNHWLREVMPTRLNDIRRSAVICIQQRTHEEDATGVLLGDGDDWTHLMIPMRYEPERHCITSTGWTDPRVIEDELAWPERFPAREVAILEEKLGPYAVAGQFQQAPEPRGGGIISAEWWQHWPPEGEEAGWTRQVTLDDGQVIERPIFPDLDVIIASVDGAFTETEGNDYCACTVWGTFTHRGRPGLILLEAWRERMELHAFVLRIIDTCRRRHADRLLIENKASGRSAAQEVRRLMRAEEWVIETIEPRGDKAARLLSVQPLFAGGIVWAPFKGPAGYRWVNMVIDEVKAFPRAAHDDLTDTVSQALFWLRRTGVARLPSEADADETERLLFRGNRPSLADAYGVG